MKPTLDVRYFQHLERGVEQAFRVPRGVDPDTNVHGVAVLAHRDAQGEARD